jgi:hypothetical protein
MKGQKKAEKSSIPHGGPKSVEPHDGCGAKKKSGGVCTQPKGFGTSHVGKGRCKFHGGSTPIKHGLFSAVKRESLKEAIDRYKNDPDLVDLRYEVALLRALVEDKIDATADNEADHAAIAQLIDRVGTMVDRIHRHKANGAVSFATLNRLLEQLGVEVVAAALETISDSDVRLKHCQSVERRWMALKLDAYSVSTPRSVGAVEEV